MMHELYGERRRCEKCGGQIYPLPRTCKCGNTREDVVDALTPKSASETPEAYLIVLRGGLVKEVRPSAGCDAEDEAEAIMQKEIGYLPDVSYHGFDQAGRYILSRYYDERQKTDLVVQVLYM